LYSVLKLRCAWSYIDNRLCVLLLASPVCLDYVSGSRWLTVGLENGTVMVGLFVL